MISTKSFLPIILLATLASGVFAQDSLSLLDYRNQVLDYSYTIKKADEQVIISENNLEIKQNKRLPRLTGSGTFNYQFIPQNIEFEPNNIDLRRESYRFELTAIQPIYYGGAINNEINLASTQLEAKKIAKEQSLQQIAYQADITYWNTAAFKKLYEINQQYLDIVQQQYQLVLNKFEAGAVSKKDRLLIESRLKEAEFLLTNTRKSYKMSQQSLNLLLGNPPEQQITLQDSITQPIPYIDTNVSIEENLKNRPDYRLAEKNILAQEYAAKLALSPYNPQITLGAQGSWGTLFLNLDGETIFQPVGFLQLNVPIFAWNEKGKTRRMYEAMIRSSENAKNEVVDLSRIELENSIVAMEEALNQITTSEESLEIAQSSLDLISYSYEEGSLSILELLQAQLSWIQAFTNNINAHLNYKIAYSSYLKAIGNLQ